MNDKIAKDWLDLAEYDFGTAKAMLDSGKYIYVALFCQQAIERVLKAIYVKEKNGTPPNTHNLANLQAHLSISADFDDKKNELLQSLSLYYLETRYTETIVEISSIVNKREAERIYKETEKVLLWLKDKAK